VKISDSSSAECGADPSPGADIDAVHLQTSGGGGWLSNVTDSGLSQSSCGYDASLLGESDGTCSADPAESGFLALGGGWIIGEFEGGQSIAEGDTVTVYEVGSAECPAGVERDDPITVSVSVSSELDSCWQSVGTSAGGQATLTIPNLPIAFEDNLPCVDGSVPPPADEVMTLCHPTYLLGPIPPPPPPLAEDILLVMIQTRDQLSRNDDVNHYQIGFVFDSDGDMSNNYTPPALYADDLWKGGDKIYSATYTPTSGWTMAVQTAFLGDFQDVSSAARMVFYGRTIALFIPLDEFAVETPRHRVTLYRHEGDWGQSPPYIWNGCVFPPQNDPMIDLTSDGLPIGAL
jgi:hypothetical protein